jgi:radical SAM superfamily enzyme YgiQ (UPF0313 family)
MPDPDSLPFPRRDLVAHLNQRYYYLFHRPVALLKTTWGCPYDCNFCFNRMVTDGKVFARSPESIANELEQITVEDIYIVDDIFLINRRRLSRLAKLIRERGIRKKYLVFGRSDVIAENEDLIEEWAELGLQAVLVGLEATTNPELDSMNKDSTMDHNRQAIKILRSHGVDIYGSFIPQPDYQKQDWDRLEKFILDTGLVYLNISPLTPLPNTKLYFDTVDQITVDRSAHGLWDLSHILLPTKQPLKEYYRSLLGVYVKAVLYSRRFRKLTMRPIPPWWKPESIQLWLGAIKVLFQFLTAHRHHSAQQLEIARQKGPEPHPQGDNWTVKDKVRLPT